MPKTNFKVGEMLQKRTPNSKTWMNFDGSYTTEVHLTDVHFTDNQGNLHNVNTDLYDEADFDKIVDPVAVEGFERFLQAKREVEAAKENGVLNRAQHNFQALRVPFDAKIPRNFQHGYTIGEGENSLTFIPIGASPSTGEQSQADRSAIKYQDVWNDTDVQIEIKADGVKETLFLKTDKAPFSFSFEVVGDGLTDELVAGTLQLMPAWLVDAVGTYRDVEQKVTERGGVVYLELIAPVDGLVYPIEIDPTVTVTGSASGWHTASYSSFGTTSDVLRHGMLDGYREFGFIKFNKSILPMLEGDIINSATLDLTIFQITGGEMVTLNRMTENWDGPSDFQGVGSSKVNSISTTFERKKSTAGLVAGNVINYDITQFLDWWHNGVYPNYGLRMYSENFFTSYQGVTGGTAAPKLTINYNSKPTKPSLLVPNGGESWNSTHTVSWQASTDLDGTALVYEVQLSTDNGTTWSTIGSNISGTSYTYDFISKAETTNARIRVRAYDGVIYSDYDTSDAVFIIQHDHAPYPPADLSPVGIVLDRTKTIKLEWTHSDQNPNDPQAKAEVQWRMQGAPSWNTIVINGVTQYTDIAANTFSVGKVEWRVRTTDQTALVGAYTNPMVFSTSNPTVIPVILQPDSVFSGARPVIQWMANDQVSYQLVILDGAGATIWDTGEVMGTAKSRESGVGLKNGANYTIKLRVRGAGGLYSEYVIKNISISYTPPPIPVIVTATVDNERGSLTLNINNPAPTGTQPAIARNNILRKKKSESIWVRIANDVPPNGTFVDYTATSANTYEYIVQAWGGNDAFTNSEIFENRLAIEHAQLALVSDYSEFVVLEYNQSTSQSKGYNRALTTYAGRKFPLAEFTQEETLGLSTDYLIKTHEEVETLYRLLDKKETFLYRDREGRRAYVTIGGISESEIGFGEFFSVSFQMDKVYVREEV